MDEERRKQPSQATIDNTVAIGKLTAISERTTNDVDKLVRHIEKFLPVHEKLSNLKKILYSSMAVIMAYGVWITLECHRMDTRIETHSAVQTQKEKEITEDMRKIKEEMRYIEKKSTEGVSENKNQIVYLKGRLKAKEGKSSNSS